MPVNPVNAAQDEEGRLKALERYEILDSPPETAYDDVTHLASSICDTPIALVTLVDKHRQWFKSSVGLQVSETSREVAFCAHTIDCNDVMLIEDARADERFRDNALVTGPPYIRFYAGAPLLTPDGYRLGAVCVIDRKPRTLSGAQVEALQILARQVIANLELRRASKLNETASAALTLETQWQRNLFFERSLDMLVIADLKSRFHTTNPACTHILGYPPEALCTMNYFDLVHPDDVQHVRDELARLAAGENVRLLDVRMRTKEGDYRDIRWNSVPWTEDHLVFAVGRDVTWIRAAERALREQELMLRRTEQMAQIGSWQFISDSGQVHLSKGLLAIIGRDDSLPDVQLDDLLALFVENDRELLRHYIAEVTASSPSARVLCGIKRVDGELRSLQVSMDVVVDSNGEVYGVVAACLDVTDMNRTVERLQHSESQLRALTRRLEQIREEERTHISREIHDELGQMLTAMKLDLTMLAQEVSEADAGLQPEAINKSLYAISKRVDSTIKTVRTIATQLRPEVLDAFGLLPAIQWHAREFQNRTKIQCIVKAPHEPPQLAEEARTALFRITQEALTNAARHADADRVVISMNNHADAIDLCIEDNGCGMRPEGLTASNSLGVLGMKERASMIGATFEIDADQGIGTKVHVRLPMHGNHYQ